MTIHSRETVWDSLTCHRVYVCACLYRTTVVVVHVSWDQLTIDEQDCVDSDSDYMLWCCDVVAQITERGPALHVLAVSLKGASTKLLINVTAQKARRQPWMLWSLISLYRQQRGPTRAPQPRQPSSKWSLLCTSFWSVECLAVGAMDSATAFAPELDETTRLVGHLLNLLL